LCQDKKEEINPEGWGQTASRQKNERKPFRVRVKSQDKKEG
jgi:hypothetical protein